MTGPVLSVGHCTVRHCLVGRKGTAFVVIEDCPQGQCAWAPHNTHPPSVLGMRTWGPWQGPGQGCAYPKGGGGVIWRDQTKSPKAKPPSHPKTKTFASGGK